MPKEPHCPICGAPIDLLDADLARVTFTYRTREEYASLHRACAEQWVTNSKAIAARTRKKQEKAAAS